MNTDFGKLLKSAAKGKHGSKNLSRENAAYAMGCILDGSENDARIAAFLTAMRFKGVTSEELSGFLDGMKSRYRTKPIELPGLIDSAGAYDGRTRTLHLSLAGTIIACASGCPVITHSGSDLPAQTGGHHRRRPGDPRGPKQMFSQRGRPNAGRDRFCLSP